MSRARVFVAAGAALVLLTAAGAYLYVRAKVESGLGGVGVAIGAEIGCADVFLMKRTVGDAERDDVHGLTPALNVVRLRVDRAHSAVTAAIPGLLARTAFYRPGQGCTLLTGGAPPPPPAPDPASADPSAPWPVAAPAERPAALDAAVDRVFRETNLKGYPDTRAVLVVQNGAIVAEQYAPGFTAATPFLGWSATKSVTSALVGVLVRDGRLQLDDPAPVPEWRAPGDPRGKITLRQLLTMTSGLKFVEDYVPGSDSIRMLFQERDMAAYAASLPLAHPPGTAWSYSSGTANIVSRIVKDTVGGTTAAYDRFARDQLFGPAGIGGMLIEPDESGTPAGSSYGYATARDWARFGLLYLDRGVIDGRRILPESWIDFTTTPTPAAPTPDYGAMFWLNQGPAGGKGARIYPHCPPDMFLAEGHNGQFIAVVPSRRVVIVRLGWTPEGKRFDLDRYFSGILAALPG